MANTSNTLVTRILLLNGTQAEWQNLKSYVLTKGEPAVEFIPTVGSDSTTLTAVKVKVGDGFTTYENLPYVGDELREEFLAKFDELAAQGSSNNAVFQIDASTLDAVEGDTEADKIGNYITDEVTKGDIAIVKRTIVEDNYSYTAYVYNGTVWAAMSGNYNAENVYFNENITYTANIGALTLPSGKSSATYEAQGKSLEAVIKGILAKTIAPTITGVSYTLSSDGVETDTGTKEIGSKITKIKLNGKFNSGKYSYVSKDDTGKEYTANNGTGITATYAMSNNKDSQTSTSLDGSFTLETPIQIDTETSKVYSTVAGEATWGASTRHPVNNIGDIVDGTLEGGSSEATADISVTGFRSSFYYVGTDAATTVDSAFIRGAVNMNANTKDFNVDTFDGKACLTIPQGTQRIVIAVPGNATLNGVTDIDGMGLDVKGNFSTNKIDVSGANGFTATEYTVFICENTAGIAATHYAFSIS